MAVWLGQLTDQYAATACCAAAVILGVSLPLLNLRCRLLLMRVRMGMLCACFAAESPLSACPPSPATQIFAQILKPFS